MVWRHIRRGHFASAVLLAGIVISAMGVEFTREAAAAERESSAATSSAGMVGTDMAWPTGDRKSSVILIERMTPAEVRVGEQFEYQIRLTNLTKATISNLVVTEQLLSGFEVKSLEPRPDETKAGLASWKIGALGGSETTVIRIIGLARSIGTFAPCNTLTFSTTACQTTSVVQPALQLVKTAPAEVIICDPIPVNLVVTNTGSGSAIGVTISDMLPEGWTTSDGKSSFVVNVGTLKAGETRQTTVELRSSKTGTFTNEAMASEAGGLSARASAQTVVRQPVLAVTKKGPEMVYAGRPVTYEITVANKGDATASNTVLVDVLDAGVAFTQATDGGMAANGKVRWELGALAPGQSKTVKVTIEANTITTIRNTATATAYCAEAEASGSTVVRGIPAILLELEDIDDPIEVGANTTYVIVVTNQGSASDTNIKIVCTLPDAEEFVSASGPTTHMVQGNVVAFEPLSSLKPKAKATYRVVVKGVRPKDARFAVELTSDMLTRPVNETESTFVYE